jgi:predicted lipid carrier protein YhbT
MSSVVDEFFGELGRRGYLPELAKTSGSVRFDLTRDGQVDHWLVVIERGNVQVSRENAAADCTLRADAGLIEGIVTGRQNTVTAYLRGAADATGNTEMLIHLRRIFPGPPQAASERKAAG